MKLLNLVSVTVLSIFLTALTSGTAFASTVETTDTNQEALIQKQAEIDTYLFKEHADEILAKGINISYTGLIADAVEIGIDPFSQESADYLYAIFGDTLVVVVEGQQPVTLELTPPDATVVTTDTTTDETNNEVLEGTDDVLVDDTNMATTSIDTDMKPTVVSAEVPVKKDTLSLPIILTLVAVILVGSVLVIKNRFKASTK